MSGDNAMSGHNAMSGNAMEGGNYGGGGARSEDDDLFLSPEERLALKMYLGVGIGVVISLVSFGVLLFSSTISLVVIALFFFIGLVIAGGSFGAYELKMKFYKRFTKDEFEHELVRPGQKR